MAEHSRDDNHENNDSWHSDELRKKFSELVEHDPELSVICALNEFDRSTQQFNDDIASIGAEIEQFRAAHGTIHIESIDDMTNAFVGVVRTLSQSEPDRVAVMEIVEKLWSRDSADRIELYRRVTGQPTDFENFAPGALEDLVQTTFADAKTEEELCKTLGGMYRDDIHNDFDMYMLCLMKQANTLPTEACEETTMNIVKTPRDHAIDVLKIATGVAIALGVDRLLRRKT